MYDDDEDDEEYVEESVSGPASGGYGGGVDEDDDDEDDDEVGSVETLRREAAELARGKDERAFYDNIAKQEDERHNAMRKDKDRRSLLVGEQRQKLRHKEAEVKQLEQKIQMEEDRIVFEQKKQYRSGATSSDDIAPVTVSPEPEVIPILSRDIDPNDMDEEFSIERAQAHIKQLKEQKADLDRVVADMRAKLNEEERALSQLEHQIMRM